MTRLTTLTDEQLLRMAERALLDYEYSRAEGLAAGVQIGNPLTNLAKQQTVAQVATAASLLVLARQASHWPWMIANPIPLGPEKTR